jgi:hypothetical protein
VADPTKVALTRHYHDRPVWLEPIDHFKRSSLHAAAAVDA